MIAGRDRVVNVVAAVEAVRDAHPELRAPLTGTLLWRVLQREGILVRREPIRQKARVSGFDGDYIITIRTGLPPRDAWRYAAHEYAHVKLHMQHRGEHVRNLSPCRRGDLREDEANLFALLLSLGADASVDHPRAAAIADRIVARAVRARRPAQLALELPPTPAPSEHPRLDPSVADVDRHEDARSFLRRTSQMRISGAMRFSTIGRGCSHDALRYDWSREGRPLRWFDYSLGWLEVYDYRVIETPDGSKKAQQLRVGDSRVEVRLFVISSKEQRRYRFKEEQRRSFSCQDLEKQLAMATPVPQHQTGADTRRATLDREDAR